MGGDMLERVEPEDRTPFRVRCGKCQHVWTAAYLPMEVGSCCRLLKGVRCPMCAAGGREIFLATTSDQRAAEGA